jgi:hypothetical protein
MRQEVGQALWSFAFVCASDATAQQTFRRTFPSFAALAPLDTHWRLH